MTLANSEWSGQRVFITGVCGTVGQELLRQVVLENPEEVVGIDNNESELFFLKETYRDNENVHLYLCDVRDREQLIHRSREMDIVLHAAALKHVILCEQAPRDAVQTNILGTQNVVDAGFLNHVGRVIFTSSDKAVNPTNVMGTSKLMGERLMTAANAQRRHDGPIFASTRFGNVLGSRGSVIPLFRRQIEAGGPVTLTDEAMTRFIMTLREAVSLVMRSVFVAKGGEVFVMKMPAVRIVDLAEVMIEELAPTFGYSAGDIEIRRIGSKAGEKLYEELVNEEEVRRTVELERFYSVLPAFRSVYRAVDYTYPEMTPQAVLSRGYRSDNVSLIRGEELRAHLIDNRLFELPA